ncbi:hypothetical protein SO802_004570 [Lithocarpus litseifolius]|uniref:Uncharacterized protein n=1 Tax=Lithocarpus litseifolius TaxID=425828 RepID=A0AAW2E4C1_9ROSI
MDFFKSVFFEDPDLDPNPDSDSDSTAIWSFGRLIKTIASKSEISSFHEVDDQKLMIREVALCAVMDFLASLDASASVPQESLESVGQAIDDIGSSVWKSTAEIITHGVDKLFVTASADSDSNPIPIPITVGD